jgi:hypothetical protein
MSVSRPLENSSFRLGLRFRRHRRRRRSNVTGQRRASDRLRDGRS